MPGNNRPRRWRWLEPYAYAERIPGASGGGVGSMDSNNGTQFKQQNRIYDSNGLALCESATKSFNPWYTDGVRIRKLTPRECWRLMAFKDEDFDKASQVCSDSRLYSQAGNSICVNVLEMIFENLLGEENGK